jgi:iron complex outermembrane receptor protein
MFKWTLSLSLTFLTAIQGIAQTNKPDEKDQIEPVITKITVTGTRSPMEVDKSPVSTSLVTRPEIEQRNVQQLDQVLNLMEGVSVIRPTGVGDSEVGVGLRGFSGRSSQGRTLILIDGQPVNDSYNGNVRWSAFAVNEMERVEVARGPFSSLYGGNAMGGVINIITRPIEQRQVEIFGQYGSRDISNYSMRYADRLFEKLRFSGGYNRLQNGGYAAQEVLRAPSASLTGGTPVTGVRRWLTTSGGTTFQVGERGRNWSNEEALRGRVEYIFSPKLFATAQYMWQSHNDGYDAYRSNLRDSAGNIVDRGTVVFDDAGVTRRVSLTPYNFMGGPAGYSSGIYQGQILATLNPRWNLKASGGFNDIPLNWYVTPASTATLESGAGSYNNTINKSVYGNIQASFQSEKQGVIFGTETRHDQARTGAQTIANYAIRENQGAYNTQARGRSINQAAYGQFQGMFFQRLNIVTGARWDYWKTYDGATQTAATEPLNLFADRSANALTGKVAASYALRGAWQLRGSVGSAFRNPQVFDLYRDVLDGSIFLLANPLLKPERLLAFEGGVVGTFRQWGISATLFQNDVSDLIYRVTDYSADPNGGIRRFTNAGKGRIRGAEASAKQQPWRWLQLRQTYTYTNSIITRNDALPATVGKRVPYVPRHTAAYSATVSRQKWSLTWTGRYVSRMYSTDGNTDVVRGVPGGYDPYFVTDATASYDVNRHLTFIVNADNLIGRRAHVYYLTPGRAVFAGFRWRL